MSVLRALKFLMATVPFAAQGFGMENPDAQPTETCCPIIELHPERFLRFDKFPVEQIDQHIPLPWMQRVLPQFNDRAASFRRLRVRLFHGESLRRE